MFVVINISGSSKHISPRPETAVKPHLTLPPVGWRGNYRSFLHFLRQKFDNPTPTPSPSPSFASSDTRLNFILSIGRSSLVEKFSVNRFVVLRLPLLLTECYWSVYVAVSRTLLCMLSVTLFGLLYFSMLVFSALSVVFSMLTRSLACVRLPVGCPAFTPVRQWQFQQGQISMLG